MVFERVNGGKVLDGAVGYKVRGYRFMRRRGCYDVVVEPCIMVVVGGRLRDNGLTCFLIFCEKNDI